MYFANRFILKLDLTRSNSLRYIDINHIFGAGGKKFQADGRLLKWRW